MLHVSSTNWNRPDFNLSSQSTHLKGSIASGGVILSELSQRKVTKRTQQQEGQESLPSNMATTV